MAPRTHFRLVDAVIDIVPADGWYCCNWMPSNRI